MDEHYRLMIEALRSACLLGESEDEDKRFLVWSKMSLDEFESKFSKTIQETEYKHLGFEFMIEGSLEGLTKIPPNAKKFIRCKVPNFGTVLKEHFGFYNFLLFDEHWMNHAVIQHKIFREIGVVPCEIHADEYSFITKTGGLGPVARFFLDSQEAYAIYKLKYQ